MPRSTCTACQPGSNLIRSKFQWKQCQLHRHELGYIILEGLSGNFTVFTNNSFINQRSITLGYSLTIEHFKPLFAMIFLGFLSLSLLYAQILGFNLSGKEYEIYKTSEGEVTKSIIYSVSSSPEKNWIVKSIYNNSYLKTG